MRSGHPLVTSCQPDVVPFNTTLITIKPVFYPSYHILVHLTNGQFIQKATVRDVFKSLPKILKDFIHHLPFIH